MKKRLGIFIFVLVMLFMSFNSVYAREIQLKDLNDLLDSDTNTAYIIGEYVFTSKHKLTLEDAMLAARSIKVKDTDGKIDSDPIYGEMSIIGVRKTYESDDDLEGTWVYDSNLSGETTIDGETKLDIKYVDYAHVKDIFTVTLETDGDEYQDSIQVEEGSKINKDLITGGNKPTKPNKQFKEWVISKNGKDEPWDFDSDTVDGNITLKATWYDEVNTDKLLEDASKKIQSEYYGIEFKDKVLTYNIYDKNKKNSEIKGTGLVGIIRDIINEDNVASLTVTYGGETFEFDSADMGDDSQSKAYQKLQELLKKVAGKDFESMIQADLVGKELTLTVKLNEETARSQNGDTEESYTVKFVYEANAVIDNDVPESDKQILQSQFNYFTDDDKYTITGSDGDYKVNGWVTEKTGIKGFGNSQAKYFFTYVITLDDDVVLENVKIKIPKIPNPSNNSDYNIYEKSDLTERKLTVLMELDGDSEQTKYRDIIVEIDGKPITIRIDFSQLKYEKSSTFTIEKLDDESDPFNSPYGWKENDGYSTTFSKIDENPHKVEVTGLLPIFSNDEWDSDPFNPGYGPYYLGFIVKLDDKFNVGDSEDITVKFIHGGEEENTNNVTDGKAITSDDFKDSKKLYVLKYLKHTNTFGFPVGDSEKQFDVTVDLDGDGDEYAPYTVTIDWSKLKLQKDSTSGSDYEPVGPDGMSEDDKQTITETWGFDFTLDNIEYKTENKPEVGEYHTGLQGTVKQQTLEKAAGFKDSEGYYVPVKISVPSDLPSEYKNSWTIWLKDESGDYREVKPSETDYTNGYIVVLFRMKYGTQNISYKIDYDGNGNDFLLSDEIVITTDFTYLSENHLTYKYKDNTGEEKTEDEIVYENDSVKLKELGIDTDYRKFDKWTSSKEITDNFTSGHDEDLTLTAHWILDSDAFVKAVLDDLNDPESEISNDYSEKFEMIIGEDNDITIDVKDSRVLLSDMNDTTIPGAIAYILQKGEIKSITLSTEDKKVEFTKDGANNDIVSKVDLDSTGETLKETIKSGAKALFTEILSDQESTMTLSKMALNDKSFTIEIGDNDETVTLLDDVNKAYTFSFETEAITVNDESELESALGNTKISHIYLGKDIEVTKQHDINRSLTINGGKKDEEGSYKISVKSENKGTTKSIFKVRSSNAIIDNMELSGVEQAIIIDGESASLTISGLKLLNIEKAGIEVVKGGLTSDSDGIVFEEESHDIPAVRIQHENKSTAKVRVKDATENNPGYINVAKHRKEWCADENNYGKDDDSTLASCTKKKIDDDFTPIMDTYYYLNSKNVKNYSRVDFMGVSGKMWITRLYDEEETKIGPFDSYYGKEKISKENKDLYFIGYGKIRRSEGDMFNGDIYYGDLITNIADEPVGTRTWYFANFAERDEAKKVTVDPNTVDDVSESKTYYTYKFKDITDSMTIGQLKAIDHDFSEMWKKLEEKAKSTYKTIKYTKDSDGEKDATDGTKIDGEIKLKLGDPSIEKP